MDDTTQTDETTVADETSRRGVLRAALLAAGGAAAAVMALDADPASAGSPANMTTGVVNTENSGLSEFDYTGTVDGTAYLFQAGSTHSAADSAGVYQSALGGWTSNSRYPNGIYAYTDVQNGAGLVAIGNGAGGTGVVAKGSTAVSASTTSGFAVAATATDGFGIAVQVGNGFGISASVTTGFGVAATSYHGTAVAASSQAGGPGVSAASYEGVGVTSVGKTYALEATSADTAALRLGATSYSSSAPRTAPPSRTDAHLVGEIDVDGNGDLWCCVAAGTPGTWRKLAGTTTAGSFHPLTPGRVYDSRLAVPGPAAKLVAASNRTVSVAARRSLDTGAVVQADFVPAGATAIAANVTVVDTVAAGFLTVNPGGTTTINAATINWSAAGQILNNGVNLTLNATRQLTVIAGGDSNAATHVVIDVTGYYL